MTAAINSPPVTEPKAPASGKRHPLYSGTVARALDFSTEEHCGEIFAVPESQLPTEPQQGRGSTNLVIPIVSYARARNNGLVQRAIVEGGQQLSLGERPVQTPVIAIQPRTKAKHLRAWMGACAEAKVWVRASSLSRFLPLASV